ncbi:hypothetical protein Tco_0972013 [Tanacetum coccineum]
MKISSFMDAHKCPELAKRFADKVPKTVDEMMMGLDDFVRSEEAFASTELPKGEVSEASKRSMGPTSRREDRFNRGGYGADRRRNDGRNTFNNRDGLVPYYDLAPYQAHRDQGPQRPRFNLSSLTKLPKEILAMESQLNLQPPRPMQLPPKKENQDRYCDYHGEKGHYTNEYFQLKRQLEMALESGKLNHLIKYVRRRGQRNAKGGDAGKDKIINMISLGRMKRKENQSEGTKRQLWKELESRNEVAVEEHIDGSSSFRRGSGEAVGLELEVVFDDGALRAQCPNDTLMIKFPTLRRYRNPGCDVSSGVINPNARDLKSSKGTKGSSLRKSQGEKFRRVD